MKIKYREWICVVCKKISRFTGEGVFSAMPYWFTIKTEGCVSSSERPSFNTAACSIVCLEKSASMIEGFIKNRQHLIPDKKDIVATICDQCGKVRLADTLNPAYGTNPFKDWIGEESSAGRKDFCCNDCKRNHTLYPEQSVFAGFNLDQSWEKARIIRAINSPDFKEAMISSNKDPLFKVRLPEQPSS